MSKSHRVSLVTHVPKVVIGTMMILSLARIFIDAFALEMLGHSLSQGGDFAAYYFAGVMQRQGEDIYNLDRALEFAAQSYPDVRGSLEYLYPPPLAIAMVPLSLCPFRWAYRFWVIGEMVCLFGALYLLSRNLPSLGKWTWPVLIILTGNMYPLYLSSDLGQVGMLLLLILVVILHLARRKQFFWAGAAIGVAAMIKMSPLLLIGFFALQRRWKAPIGALTSIAFLTGVTFALGGLHVVESFVHTSLAQSIPRQVEGYANMSVAAVVHRWLVILNASVPEAFVRWILVVLILVLLATRTYKQFAPSSDPFALCLVLWIVAMLLISPITWEHHLIWLIPTFGLVVVALAREQGRTGELLLLWFAITYAMLAFENLPLNRFGQWRFQRGWWIFSGDYLRTNLIADVRLFALGSLFMLLFALMRRQVSVDSAEQGTISIELQPSSPHVPLAKP